MALDTDIREGFRAAGAAAVSDAMERLSLPRSVVSGFTFIGAEGAVSVGSALTIRQVPKHYPARHEQRLVRHGEIGTALAKPDDFVVVDAGGRCDIAGWGANHATRCQARGVSGVLVNGAVRDISHIRRLGLPSFCLGASPVASRWDQETVEFNGPVVIAGVQIRSGDIIVGDEDGLVVIAPEQAAAILAELRP